MFVSITGKVYATQNMQLSHERPELRSHRSFLKTWQKEWPIWVNSFRPGHAQLVKHWRLEGFECTYPCEFRAIRGADARPLDQEPRMRIPEHQILTVRRWRQVPKSARRIAPFSPERKVS